MSLPVVPSDAIPLGHRIARRTTDLIVISLIAIAGLTVTQRLIVWWRTDPADLRVDPEVLFSRAALTPWGVGPEGVSIDLPEQALTLNRRTFAGTFDAAIAQLRDDCREVLQGDLDPATSRGETEADLITTLMKHPAAEVDPERRWSLHEIGSPLTMTIGVRRGEAPGSSDRVVCWGLVLPFSEGVWSLLRVTPTATSVSMGSSDSPRLPVGCRPGLAVRDDLGGQLITFTGAGPLDAWRRHFDGVARERDWREETDWRITGDAATAAWVANSDGEPRRIDLQLTTVPSGWTGLINISPTRGNDHP